MLFHKPLLNLDVYTERDIRNNLPYNYDYEYLNIFKSWDNLQMTKDTIWLTSDDLDYDVDPYLCALNCTKDGSMSDDNWVIEKCTSPARSIVPCNDIIVTNHVDGSIIQWTIESLDGRKYFNKKVLLNKNTHFNFSVIDVASQYIILGLRCEIKIWNYITQENVITDENILSKLYLANPWSWSIKSIAFDSTETKFAAGLEKNKDLDKTKYIIHDINKRYIEADKEIDIYYLIQLLWGDPNTILLLGARQIKKVDVRTHNVVHTWNAPFNTNDLKQHQFSCMSSDNLYAYDGNA